ncbi:MAG: PspC domain-containing protein [Bryobacteraceae bacterium]
MYCTQCGFKLDDGDVYCAKCGSASREDAPPRAEGSVRRLYRPTADRKIAGVCAGFALYLGVDPVLIRVLWLALALGAGVGFIAYIIAWIVMPKEESLPSPVVEAAKPKPAC